MTTPSLPRSTSPARMGVVVLVIALAMTFGTGLILYAIARTGAGGHLVRDTMQGRLPSLPVWLWVSTFLLFTSSVALHQSLQWMRTGLPRQARNALRVTTALGWGFVALQIPGLAILAARHRPESGERSVVYFLVLFLVGLHLLHAAGGLLPMTQAARKATFAHDDPSGAERLRNLSIYWHFLAGVWLAMFATFSLVR